MTRAGRRARMASMLLAVATLMLVGSAEPPWADAASTRHGNVRLTLSGSNLLLSETNGEGVFLDGTTRSLPSGGVTLSPTGTAANTTYYVYAYWTGSAVALEYATTNPETDSASGRVGIMVKGGQTSRSLVGMARTNGSAQWVDSPSQRFVISWFNRRPIAAYNHFADNRTTSSAAWVELSSSERAEFLTWGDGAVIMGFAGTVAAYSGSVTGIFTSIGIDGTSPEETGMADVQSTSGSDTRHVSGFAARALSEGYHYATILGGVNNNQGTWYGDPTNKGMRLSLTLVIHG